MNILITHATENQMPALLSAVKDSGTSYDLLSSLDEAAIALGQKDYDLVIYAHAAEDALDDKILTLRKNTRRYPYIVLASDVAAEVDALQAAANAIMPLSASKDDLHRALGNATQLHGAISLMGNDDVDFPSAGGIISRSAFNQLFLSGIERGNRFGEKVYILMITLQNYDDLRAHDGAYVADYTTAQLSRELVKMRRQSDIIGQISESSFALLLMRPPFDYDPTDAAKRYCETLSHKTHIARQAQVSVDIEVSLISLPDGNMAYRAESGIQHLS